MTTFAEEVTQHLELFIKHLTDNNEVIDEYNEEFLVDEQPESTLCVKVFGW